MGGSLSACSKAASCENGCSGLRPKEASSYKPGDTVWDTAEEIRRTGAPEALAAIDAMGACDTTCSPLTTVGSTRHMTTGGSSGTTSPAVATPVARKARCESIAESEAEATRDSVLNRSRDSEELEMSHVVSDAVRRSEWHRVAVYEDESEQQGVTLYESGQEQDEHAAPRNSTTPVLRKAATSVEKLLEDEFAHLQRHRQPVTCDSDVKQIIREAMKKDPVCAIFEMEGESIEAVMDAMEYLTFEKGDMVIAEGGRGDHWFVLEKGELVVTNKEGQTINTLQAGAAFGSLAMLHSCPRTATITAVAQSSVWGVRGTKLKDLIKVTMTRHFAENRKFLDAVSLFDPLTSQQKDRVCEVLNLQVFEDEARVVTEKDVASAMYFVKKGTLQSRAGGTVDAQGKLVGGLLQSTLGQGDCFGESALLHQELRPTTMVCVGRCEVAVLTAENMRKALCDKDESLSKLLEENIVRTCIKRLEITGHFSPTQLRTLVKTMESKAYSAGASIEVSDKLCAIVIVQGSAIGSFQRGPITLNCGDGLEGLSIINRTEEGKLNGALVAGKDGVRLALLTSAALAKGLRLLGMSAVPASEALDYNQKILSVKKVPVFRHCAPQQINDIAKSLTQVQYQQHAVVIKEGEFGSQVFVVKSGEVSVSIKSKFIRTMGINTYFGERSLLLGEPRGATISVSSPKAELWVLEKETFMSIVQGRMLTEMQQRIQLHNTNVNLKQLRHMDVIGRGATGIVRVVEHVETKAQYALKRVKKKRGKVPPEVQREAILMAENDHPFIMTVVSTFETDKSVYFCQELISGGELFDAIRRIPKALSRQHCQFYGGSILLMIESLSERNILFRDLKPENVMLDAQGYLKLIDFGIAKKLTDTNCKTFTVIGTPHYMAPEVVKGKGYGLSADVWSCGVMIYEFVSCKLPFGDDCESMHDVWQAVIKEKLRFPRSLKDEIAKELLANLLERVLTKRLGAGVNGVEAVKNHRYFAEGLDDSGPSLFDLLMGRQLPPPVVPKAMKFSKDQDLNLSDADELAK